MKRSKVIVIMYVLLFIIAYVIFIFGEYILYKNKSNNLLCINQAIYDYEDGFVNVCNGLGYKVINYQREAITKTEFVPFWIKMKDPEVNKRKFTVIDETEICSDALEEFYEDENHKYYFDCIRSGNVYILFKDGAKKLVKEALNNNDITITELINEIENYGPDSIKIYTDK